MRETIVDWRARERPLWGGRGEAVSEEPENAGHGVVGVAVRQEVPAGEEIRSGGSAAQMRSKRGSGKGLIFSVPGTVRRCRKGLECLAWSGLQLLGVRLIAVWRKAWEGHTDTGELGCGAGHGGRREAGWSGLAGDQAAEGPDGSAQRSGGGGLKRQRRVLREENRSKDYPFSDSAGVHV